MCYILGMSKKDSSKFVRVSKGRRFREEGEGVSSSASISSTSSVNSSEGFVSQAPENIIKTVKNPFEEDSK